MHVIEVLLFFGLLAALTGAIAAGVKALMAYLGRNNNPNPTGATLCLGHSQFAENMGIRLSCACDILKLEPVLLHRGPPGQWKVRLTQPPMAPSRITRKVRGGVFIR